MPNRATGSPEKRALEENSRQKGCLSVEGQSHQCPPPLNPHSHPLRLPPWLLVFARQLRLGTLFPLTGSQLRSLRAEGCPETNEPRRGVLPQSHGVLQAEREPSTALCGEVWQRILTVPQRRSGWAPGQATSGSVIGICCLLAQVRELQKG